MNYFCIEPEVARGLGQNVVMDRSVHPPVVDKLHYEFDGWLGDVLLETFPCFIVTEGARKRLQLIHATGIKFDQAEVTTSEQFRELYPDRKLPKFAWLKVVGTPGRDDFGIGPDFRLVISERALEALKELGISNAVVTPYEVGK